MEASAFLIYEAIKKNPGLNERELAERVGLKKTPYTRQILLNLIANGHIVRFWDESRIRKCYTYFLQETEAMK